MELNFETLKQELREVTTCGCDDGEVAQLGSRAAEAIETLEAQCKVYRDALGLKPA